MNCPVCSGRAIGKVGVEQYYCWDCCVEFTTQTDKLVIYDLAEDGSLLAWDDPIMDSVEADTNTGASCAVLE